MALWDLLQSERIIANQRPDRELLCWGVCHTFGFNRVFADCGICHNADLDLCGTVYRCVNRLRSCNTALKIVSRFYHPIKYLQFAKDICIYEMGCVIILL